MEPRSPKTEFNTTARPAARRPDGPAGLVGFWSSRAGLGPNFFASGLPRAGPRPGPTHAQVYTHAKNYSQHFKFFNAAKQTHVCTILNRRVQHQQISKNKLVEDATKTIQHLVLHSQHMMCGFTTYCVNACAVTNL
jgi:hypothetical protein